MGTHNYELDNIVFSRLQRRSDKMESRMGWWCCLSKKKKKRGLSGGFFFIKSLYFILELGCLAPIPVGIICVKGVIFI